MAEMQQTTKERARLNRLWNAHPKVQKFQRELGDFVRANGLDFDVKGMNRSLEFGIAWTKANGPLPDSGIKTG